MREIRRRLFTRAWSGKSRYDYIVVGGGSAGCVLADSLSENGKNSVLLLEAGKSSGYYPWFHIPVGYLFTIDNPRSDWCFKTSPEKYLNNRKLLYPRGYGLGGSSLINGMIYMRGQQADYDHWANILQDQSWNWENILPIFLKQENYYGEGGRFHGKSGKWRVEKVRTNWEILDAFIDASEKYGIPHTNDFNTGDNTGVGYFDVNQRDGWRLNAFQAFLSSPKENLTICSSSHVDKLLFSTTNNSLVNEPQCIGVSMKVGNETQQVYAEREVILTAGAIGTVQLLERSGVGQQKHLDSLGIDVVHQLPGVGENLQDHLQLRLVFEVDNTPTLNLRANSLLGKMSIAWEYLTSRTGPMASAPSQLGAFCKSSPKHETANIQYHIQPLSLPAFGQPLDSFNAFTASVCDLRPTSTGSVHIQSPEINSHPKIQMNYLSTERDQEVAVESIEITREIVSCMDPKFHPREKKPGLQYKTKEELVRAAGDIGTTIFHPVGTCKMGLSDDPTAVVDSQLRVYGIKNLRIADCSVMPSIVSGNTAAPAMMIGAKCGQMILDETAAPLH